MSVEEDIGALKKGMENVEGATVTSANRIDELVTKFIEHSTAQTARQDRADERHDELADGHDKLKSRHYKLERDVPSQKKIMGTLAIGVPLVGALGVWIGNLWDTIKGGGG